MSPAELASGWPSDWNDAPWAEGMDAIQDEAADADFCPAFPLAVPCGPTCPLHAPLDEAETQRIADEIRAKIAADEATERKFFEAVFGGGMSAECSEDAA